MTSQEGDGEQELAALTRVHAIAAGFVREGDLVALLEESVAAAVAFAGADIGTIQQLAADAGGPPRLTAHHGLDEPLRERLARCPLSPAARVLIEHGEPLVLADLADSPLVAGAPDLEALRAAGVRASTLVPLRSHGGSVVGLLGVHHRAPRRLGSRALRLLALLAEQCADAIERVRRIDERAREDAGAAWAQKLRESEERFRTTVENIPLNLILYDRGLRVLYVNPALAAACTTRPGLSIAENMVGRLADELWPDAVLGPLNVYTRRAIETGERQTYELALSEAGQRAVRQWTVVPLSGPDGQVQQVLVMSHDITAQRRLLDELREADRRKSEFIAVLSHELRNPLAAIRSSLYVLERGAASAEAARRVKGVIDRQVTQLVRMVDDLLDITRITQNKIQLQRRRLDVCELVRQTVDDNRSTLERSGVRVEARVPGAPLFVDADGARIAQVITNLLWNAVKFTPPGGSATVSVSGDGAGGQATIVVTDTGVGMEAAMLAHLFVPFMQADRTLDRTSGGLGLGLALVKGLVDLHGGDVSARSEGLGHGSAFTVRLPLAEAPSREVPAARREDAERAQRRVLVIEDDADVADGLQAALAIDEHQVEVARSGAEGLERARAFRPDVVLCDIGLPGMSGYDVARAFRADEGLRSIFLVALSGYAQADDLAEARAAGFDQHLAKPPSMDKISRIVAGSSPRPSS
jgi:PAS domain S-box-containing protein